MLSADKIAAFNARGANVQPGAFGENLVVEGFDFRALPVGTLLRCGDVLLEMTQIGKECHSHCEIFKRMGECIMPTQGVFARVLEPGEIRVGDEMEIHPRPGPALAGRGHHPQRQGRQRGAPGRERPRHRKAPCGSGL